MNLIRVSGVLLHPTSLPNRFGIGSLGAEAYSFVEFLIRAKQSVWQILPLGPTNESYSPYDCFSAFAGNPLLISLEKLVEEKLLENADLANPPLFPDNKVDYEKVSQFKMAVLKRSFLIFEQSATQTQRDDFNTFCKSNAHWLDAYALFMALRNAMGFWVTWEEDIRKRQQIAIERWSGTLSQEIMFQKYMQFQFFKQWMRLKKFCNEHGVKIIGDIAHFIAIDSAEVWWNQDKFFLDTDGHPTVVSGVPPDYFSKTGQLWGNPIYRWDEMAKDRYSWWIERLRSSLAMADIVRLDHFRGFEKYWEIPADQTTAIYGRWVAGPGIALFEEIQKILGNIPIIVEDLGIITPEVHALRDRFNFPGMRVLQFAFDSDDKINSNRPYNFQRNCVVYTGTHDNDTTVAWFNENTNAELADEIKKRKQRVLTYLGNKGEEINWDFIHLALASVADIAVIPLQDILGLGNEARMNIPGTIGGNWEWRFTFDMLTDKVTSRLRELNELFNR